MVAIFALREPNGHVTSAASKHSASSVARDSTTAHSSPASSPARSSSSPPSTGNSSPADNAASKTVPLIVLNNTAIPHLAQQAAQRFEGGGWTVTRYDNYQNQIVSTCAYYDPDVTGAKKAAEALQAQYPTIKRVKPRFAELPAGPIVVVLTDDYSAG